MDFDDDEDIGDVDEGNKAAMKERQKKP